ncbi:MAG: TonB-dependent receptor [Saprospiraceae bacterium]|nr:TonB-dependent receptor [Saprospiraceae bacterium]
MMLYCRNTLPIFLLLVAGMATAQNAIITGRVSDDKTNEGLFLATLSVGDHGAVTEIDGAYRLELPAGNYTMTISYVGYNTQTQAVAAKAGETLQLDFALNAEVSILETATVTSGKFEKSLGEVTVSMEVLKPGLVESANKNTLDGAIEKIPGVTVIDGQANIRGGSGFSQGAGSRVLLLVDDIPILQADAGYPNWDDVPMENVEQIEVLKGAASALYGSSALNGVINVRTAYPRSEPETKISGVYTTWFSPEDPDKKWWDSAPYSYTGSVSHKRKIGKLDLVLGSFYVKANSFNKDTYKEYGRFNFNTRYRLTDRLSFGINCNFNKGQSGSFFYWGDAVNPYVGETSTISSRERFRFTVDPFLTYFDKGGNRHRFVGRYYDVANENNLNQSNFSKSYYGEYQFQRQLKKLDMVMTAGVVYFGARSDSPLFGDTLLKSSNSAIYAQLDKTVGKRLNISGGFRYEYNVLNNPGFVTGIGIEVPPLIDKESKPVFRLGASYRVGSKTFLRASWGQGYRYPTIAEKYILTDAGGFFVTPNPLLRSETGWTAEVGVKHGFRVSKFDGFVDVSAFVMRYFDMMEFNLVPDSLLGLAFQSRNIGGTETPGLEVSVGGSGRIGGIKTSLMTGYTYIDPKFLDFDSTPIQAGEEQNIGQINYNNSSNKEEPVLKYRSRHTFKLDLELEWKNLSAGLETFYASNIEAIDAAFNLIITGLVGYRAENNKGYTVHNVRLGYRFGEAVKVSVLMGNILNNEYSIRPGLMEGPRNLTARVDFKF